jgi:uncharacterized membrane protein YfhO
VADALPADEQPEPGAQGSVQWESRSAETARLRVRADRRALLVLTDNFYPAWQARLDGREVRVHRADHAFRAVSVPAGDHVVEFYYDASPLRAAALTSVLLLLLLAGVTLTGLRRPPAESA